jgi:hypothetical protein
MNDKKEFIVNDYSALNKFADDEVKYANQTSRIHNAHAFGIYAKYIALLLLGVGILIFFLALFYWFYAVKPAQLIYQENNYTMDPNELRVIIEENTTLIEDKINGLDKNLTEKIIIIDKEVDVIGNSLQSDINNLSKKIDSENLIIKDQIGIQNEYLLKDFNETIISSNKTLEDKIKVYIERQNQNNNIADGNSYLYNSDDKNGMSIIENKIIEYENYNTDNDDGSEILKYKSNENYNSINDNDCDRNRNPYCDLFSKENIGGKSSDYSIDNILKKLKEFNQPTIENENIDNNSTIIVRKKFKDIKDTDCNREVNPYCDLFKKKPPGLSSKNDNNNKNKDKRSYVIYQINEVKMNGKFYILTNEWNYNNGVTSYPASQNCSVNLLTTNSKFRELRILLYKKVGVSPPQKIYTDDNINLDKLTFQKLTSHCIYAEGNNQSLSNKNRDKNYYVIFNDNTEFLSFNNTPHIARTGYVFYDKNLEIPQIQYCYTSFDTTLNNGKIVTAFVHLSEKNLLGNIVPVVGNNANMLTGTQKTKLRALCQFVD